MCIKQTTSLLLLVLIAASNSWINALSYFSEASSQAACNKKNNRYHHSILTCLRVVELGGFGVNRTNSVNVVLFVHWFSLGISEKN